MRRLVEFPLDEGGSVVIEVDDLAAGLVMRGTGKDHSAQVEQVDKTLGDATAVVNLAVHSPIIRLRSVEDPPDVVGMDLGVQLSVQTGAFIASVAAEVNFKVSMTWRRRIAVAD